MTVTDQPPIDTAAFAALRAGFRGALLRPGEEGYDQARRVWNGAVDRHPALIARCAGADDVALAVRHARAHDLPIAVKGGGHAVAGHGVCDAGVMIDLSLMRAVQVEPASRTARASGGATWRDVDAATQAFGLATPGGVVSHTGIGGLTLGGGLGHLMRRHGLTVDNLLAVDLVTAEGERIRVDGHNRPELFWGLRGGGGNFGIATAFEYRLHPVGPLVLAGPIVWPVEQAPEVLAFLDGFMRDAPDELGVTLSLMAAPPAPFLPAARYGSSVLVLIPVWLGDPDAGEDAVAPLRGQGSPIAEVVRPIPWVAVQSMLDAGAPHGRHYFWKSHRFPSLGAGVVDAFLAAEQARTSPFWQINGWAVGGAACRVDPEATAVGEREVGFDIGLNVGWGPADPEPQRHRAWVRQLWAATRHHSVGVYANFISDEGVDGVRAAYGRRLTRLTALKDRWDPDNVLRHNANIPPSSRAVRS